MPTINIEHEVDGVLTTPTSIVLADRAGTYGVKRNDTAATVVNAGTAMTAQSTGVYYHTFADPANDLTYTYWIKIVYDGTTTFSEGTIQGATSTGSGVNQHSFAGLYQRLGRYLFNSTAPTGADLTLCKEIVNDGLLDYYGQADWSFFQVAATISFTSGDYDYDLPANFGYLNGEITFPEDAGRGPLIPVSESRVRELQTGDDDAAGDPVYYAVRAKAFVAGTGQRYELVVWPTPNASRTMVYAYRVNPAALVNDSDYPLGGPLHGPAILARCLLGGERHKQVGPGGYYHQLYYGDGRTDKGALARMREMDQRNRPGSLGEMTDPSDDTGAMPVRMAEWTY